ncbi:unnamed protein product [Gongylonema pulchrum]|uniref:YuzL family protein n=1 Tax=Gongylonema pulchrum TaxID=637853 RepID=A0A183DEI1_9BILA|nr:unnamed protein product [Gongylonema pulchrum]
MGEQLKTKGTAAQRPSVSSSNSADAQYWHGKT